MSGWIAPEFVGDQSPRRLALALQHFVKEPLGSSLVPTLGHQNIQDIAVLVYRSPQVELLTLNLHEDFVNMPGITQPTSLASDRAGVFGSELETPEADGLVGDDDPSFGEQIFHIPKAESEPMVQPHAVANDFGRKTVASVAGFHEPIVADCTDCGVNLTKPLKGIDWLRL